MSASDNIDYVVLNQSAVYWPPSGELTKFGVPILGDPVELDVRWEDAVEEVITAEGTTRMSKAKAIVDRDMLVGGVLMLGDLESTTDLEDPKENDDSGEILRFEKMPNFDGDEFLRTVYL